MVDERQKFHSMLHKESLTQCGISPVSQTWSYWAYPQKTGSTLLTLKAQAHKNPLNLGASPEPFHSRFYFAELESSGTITIILY